MTNATSQVFKVIIIGAGFGGIGMAIQLKKAGIHNVVLLEKSATLGGTWHDNTYPGAACDVQSHLYSYSFEPKSDWSRKFAGQAEIRAYIEDCAAKYRLLPQLRFGQSVSSACFDEAQGLWTVTTESGERLQAQALVAATGQLNQPAWPKIDGLEEFSGKLFHSARWDHDYDLTDKRVAVIGTGASVIQFVPEIVKQVRELKLFQRSGAWVIDKGDRPFKAWEQSLFATSKLADRSYRNFIYLSNEARALAFTRFGGLLEILAWRSKWLMRTQVRSAEKRRKLLPDYKVGCKRILISNDWFPAIDRDNLDLITDGIARIDKDSIVTRQGERHQVDAIILGTGFQTTSFLTPMQVTGRYGLDLNQAWKDGAEAYKGTVVSGFPNLFLLYGPNTNLSHNSIIYMLESQFTYVLKQLKQLDRCRLRFMDVRPGQQARFNQQLQADLKRSVWTQCHSWYTNDAGKITNNWSGFTFHFRQLTRQLELADYELIPLAHQQSQTPTQAPTQALLQPA